MIRIENLSNNWDDIFSLTDITLHIKDGEYFVILGPTGSGKTLLLELIAGIYTPQAGTISLGGDDVTQLPPERRNVGFLYQDYNLFPHYDVRKNIGYGLDVRGTPKDERDARVAELIDTLSIRHLEHRDVETLSGGEQQKVGLARALAPRPNILLLDEPFSALDESTKSGLMAEMRSVHNRERVTIVHVTHSQEEAMVMADRIGIMMGGRIIQVGTPEEIFYKPQSIDVAAFVKIENIWGGTVSESSPDCTTVDLGPVSILAPPNGFGAGDPVRVMLRPEDVILGAPSGGSARNTLFGTVVSIEPRGFYALVRVDCGIPVTAAVTKRSMERLSLAPGVATEVLFKLTALHVIMQ